MSNAQSAIQFIKSPLASSSHCVVLLGKNRWLRRQIIGKIEGVFGKPQKLSLEDEDALRDIGSMVCTPFLPLAGESQKRFIHLEADAVTDIYKWLLHIRIEAEETFLLVDLSGAKKITESKLKITDKSTPLTIVKAEDPAESLAKQIITKLFAMYTPKPDKGLVDIFYERFGADFDLCEENAKKIGLYGTLNPKLLDDADVEINDVWKLVDVWVRGDFLDALKLANRLRSSEINSFAVHSQVVSQARNYYLTVSNQKNDYIARMLSQNLSNRNASWVKNMFLEVSSLNPMDETFFDALIFCIWSTFMAESRREDPSKSMRFQPS